MDFKRHYTSDYLFSILYYTIIFLTVICLTVVFSNDKYLQSSKKYYKLKLTVHIFSYIYNMP
jgi:hypothetical protein